ncbi:UNVERIFIED_ORG: hypothetical protein QOE_2784 [Clostridioides difficile F501]
MNDYLAESAVSTRITPGGIFLSWKKSFITVNPCIFSLSRTVNF